MANYQLNEVSPGQQTLHSFDGLTVREITSTAILSCAVNPAQSGDVSAVLNTTLQLNWPSIGNCTTAANASCLGLQPDQCFVLLENGQKDDQTSAQDTVSALQTVAAVTDQSDAWIIVEISGERVRDALERICPIDLDPERFVENSVARTSMEHLSVIIVRRGEGFLMLSPRSSADSFLHCVVQSAEYVI